MLHVLAADNPPHGRNCGLYRTNACDSLGLTYPCTNIATEMDGMPLVLGGLGPQWAIYEADTLAAFKDKPLKERFALCPWGLYSIEVSRG